MLRIGASQKKFNMLFLEEGEQYIYDFYGNVRFFDVISQGYRESEAIIHFSSRSLILEFQQDPNQPLYKYLLRYFKSEPQFDKLWKKGDSKSLPMKISVSRIVEITMNTHAPKPYVHHQASKIQSLESEIFELSLNINFVDISEFFNSLRDAYFLYQQKGN